MNTVKKTPAPVSQRRDRAAIETALRDALDSLPTSESPPRLLAAIRHAVLPAGSLIRPRLCMAVARAGGAMDRDMTLGVCVAIELLHCASLVHDDLPCFDDAEMRRGRPSVHRVFGEELAVLAGDALIVLAFQVLADASSHRPSLLPRLIASVAAGVGASDGIIAGQGWESEPGGQDLARYHAAKTGALFQAATVAGALVAGDDRPGWAEFGRRLGQAYQVADDVRDLLGDASAEGKPVGQDALLARPNAAMQMGVEGAVEHLQTLLGDATRAIPPCPGRAKLLDWIAASAPIRLDSGGRPQAEQPAQTEGDFPAAPTPARALS